MEFPAAFLSILLALIFIVNFLLEVLRGLPGTLLEFFCHSLGFATEFFVVDIALEATLRWLAIVRPLAVALRVVLGFLLVLPLLILAFK